MTDSVIFSLTRILMKYLYLLRLTFNRTYATLKKISMFTDQFEFLLIFKPKILNFLKLNEKNIYINIYHYFISLLLVVSFIGLEFNPFQSDQLSIIFSYAIFPRYRQCHPENWTIIADNRQRRD